MIHQKHNNISDRIVLIHEDKNPFFLFVFRPLKNVRIT